MAWEKVIPTEEDKKQEKLDAYLETGGDCCPYCDGFTCWKDDLAGSEINFSDDDPRNLEYENLDFGKATVARKVKGVNNKITTSCICADCKREWNEVYTLTDIEKIRWK